MNDNDCYNSLNIMLHISHCYSYFRITGISFLFNQTELAVILDPSQSVGVRNVNTRVGENGQSLKVPKKKMCQRRELVSIPKLTITHKHRLAPKNVKKL
jgi:hypothetical protein